MVDKLAGEYGKTRLFIRVPVIPAFNERAEEIEDIAKFVAGELSHVTGMNCFRTTSWEEENTIVWAGLIPWKIQSRPKMSI